eukprot:231962-Chlamydomonas_euryale.AAC.2
MRCCALTPKPSTPQPPTLPAGCQGAQGAGRPLRQGGHRGTGAAAREAGYCQRWQDGRQEAPRIQRRPAHGHQHQPGAWHDARHGRLLRQRQRRGRGAAPNSGAQGGPDSSGGGRDEAKRMFLMQPPTPSAAALQGGKDEAKRVFLMQPHTPSAAALQGGKGLCSQRCARQLRMRGASPWA